MNRLNYTFFAFFAILLLPLNVHAGNADAVIALMTALDDLQEYEGHGKFHLDLEVSIHRRSKQTTVPETSRTQILCFDGRMQVRHGEGQIIVDNEAFVGILAEHNRVIVRHLTPAEAQRTKDQSFALGSLRDSLIKMSSVEQDEQIDGLRHIQLLTTREMRKRSQIISIHAWLDSASGELERLAIDYSSKAPFRHAEFTVLALKRGDEVSELPPEPLAAVFDRKGDLLPKYADFTLIDLRDEAAN